MPLLERERWGNGEWHAGKARDSNQGRRHEDCSLHICLQMLHGYRNHHSVRELPLKTPAWGGGTSWRAMRRSWNIGSSKSRCLGTSLLHPSLVYLAKVLQSVLPRGKHDWLFLFLLFTWPAEDQVAILFDNSTHITDYRKINRDMCWIVSNNFPCEIVWIHMWFQ